MERCQDTQCEEQVEEQTEVSHATRCKTVTYIHEDYQEHEGYDERPESLFDRFLTERWTDYAFACDVNASCHLTALKHVCQVLSFFWSEVTSDLRTAAFDNAVYVRIRIYLVVKNDCHALVEVLLSYACPLASAFIVHGHRHYVTLKVFVVARCVNHYIATKCWTTLVGLQCHEVEETALIVECLNRPACLQVGWKQAACFSRMHNSIYCCCILHVNGTDNRTTHLTICP